MVTAKAVATLDHLAGGGRVLLGIGVGWLAEEFATLGVPFEDRGPRTDEYVAAMRDPVEPGARELQGALRLVQRGLLPAAAGRVAGSPSSWAATPARRRGGPGGWATATSRPAALSPELFDEMRRAAEQAGRNPADIELTVAAPTEPAEIEALAKRGITRVAVPVSSGAGLPAQVKTPDDVLRYGKDVIARFTR